MKKVKTAAVFAMNAAVIASMAFIGVAQIKEAKAANTLSTITEEDRHCLQQNIFFEARNQSTEGMVAVAWVTLNRLDSSRFPNTICEVVKQGRQDANGNMIRHHCQFSWYCDGKSDRVPNNVVAQRAWEDSGLVAEVVLIDWARGKDSPVERATMYHADYVEPFWSSSYDFVAQVGAHIFYQ